MFFILHSLQLYSLSWLVASRCKKQTLAHIFCILRHTHKQWRLWRKIVFWLLVCDCQGELTNMFEKRLKETIDCWNSSDKHQCREEETSAQRWHMLTLDRMRCPEVRHTSGWVCVPRHASGWVCVPRHIGPLIIGSLEMHVKVKSATIFCWWAVALSLDFLKLILFSLFQLKSHAVFVCWRSSKRGRREMVMAQSAGALRMTKTWLWHGGQAWSLDHQG